VGLWLRSSKLNMKHDVNVGKKGTAVRNTYCTSGIRVLRIGCRIVNNMLMSCKRTSSDTIITNGNPAVQGRQRSLT
jgi:hypothetical protein